MEQQRQRGEAPAIGGDEIQAAGVRWDVLNELAQLAASDREDLEQHAGGLREP
jgi:hypothetical protein